jgi:hypothetical protein
MSGKAYDSMDANAPLYTLENASKVIGIIEHQNTTNNMGCNVQCAKDYWWGFLGFDVNIIIRIIIETSQWPAEVLQQ